MLSKKQWEEHHHEKLAGLSAADKAKRYDDYRRTKSAALVKPARRLGPKAPAQRKTRSAQEVVTAAQKKSLADNDYFRQLAAPFALQPGSPAVGFPDGVTSESTVVTMTWDEVVNADTNGNAALFLRPQGPEFCLMTSGATSDAQKTWYDGALPMTDVADYPNLMFSLENGAGAFAQTGMDALLDVYVNANAMFGSYAGWSAQSVSNLEAVKANYSAVRCVGAAIEIFNPNSDVERKGTIGVAQWDGAFGAPTIYNANLAIGTARNTFVNPNQSGTGVNYVNVSSLPTFVEYSMNTPANTITARWAPLTFGSAADFRPTSYRPSWINPYTTGVLASDTDPLGNAVVNQAVAVAPAIGTSSAQLRAFYDSFFALSPIVGHTDTNGFTPNYDHVALYGGSPASGNPLAAWTNTTQEREAAFALTSMGDGDAGIIVVASGLEPSESATDGSGHTRITKEMPAFRARIRIIYECLPANSSFVPTSAPAVGASKHARHAVTAAQALTPATPGKTTASTVTDAINDVVKWTARHGGQVVDAVGSVAEAASSGSWVEIGTTILEALGALFL